MTVNPVVQGRLDESGDDDETPGAFTWIDGVKRGANPENRPVNTLPADAYTLAGLTFVCPGGCGRRGFCHVENPERDNTGQAAWSWNGDRERPTLRPSILSKIPLGCGWHGYLTDGVFTPCDDSACPGVPPTVH